MEVNLLADFLPPGLAGPGSETSSPAGSLAASPAAPSLGPIKAVRLGSRLGRYRAASPCKPAAGAGDGSGEACSLADGPATAGDTQLLAGGASPALGQPSSTLDGWVEDSCRDVCECASPPPEPPSPVAQAGTGPSSPTQPGPGAASAATPVEHAPDPVQQSEPEQCTPAAATGLAAQQQLPCRTPSTGGRSLCTPPERPFTAASQPPSRTGLRDARLLQQVELLTAKLAAEAEARRALQVQLAEQRRELEAAAQQLGETYDARLCELRQQLREAAAQGGRVRMSLGERLAAGGGEVRLTYEELEALRREMGDQEMLLRAYQAENELAVQRIKGMQAAHRQELAAATEEAERLRQQLAAAEAAGASAAQPGGSPGGVDAARLQEVLSLQSQLEAAEVAAAQREQELRQKLSEARQEKAALQARVEQLELQGTQVQVVRQVEMQLHSMRLEHARHTADMEAKLQWYQQNHELLQQSDHLVKQQAAMIVQLEQQLLSKSPARSGSSGAGAAATARRLVELERENECLRAELQAAAVPGAGAGSSEREAALAAVLQQKLAQLEAAMEQQSVEGGRRLKALRQENEKLRQEALKRTCMSKAATARLKEVEQQLEEVRSAGRKRVQALELKLKAAEARAAHASLAQDAHKPAPRPPRTAPAAPAAATNSADAGGPQREGQRIRKLERDLAQREAELASLQKRAAAADDLVNQAAAREQEMHATTRSLQRSLEEMTAANDSLREQLRELRGVEESLAASSALQARIADLQRQLEAAEQGLAVARQERADTVASASALQAGHLSELQAAREQHRMQLAEAQRLGEQLAAADWHSRVAAAEQATAELQQRVRQLEGSLADARAGIPWTPKAAEFVALERKLDALEAQHAQREAHWRTLVEECHHKMAAQGEQLRAKFEVALAAKEGQLDGFRRELDGILAAARLLQASHPPGQPAGQLALRL